MSILSFWLLTQVPSSREIPVCAEILRSTGNLIYDIYIQPIEQTVDTQFKYASCIYHVNSKYVYLCHGICNSIYALSITSEYLCNKDVCLGIGIFISTITFHVPIPT